MTDRTSSDQAAALVHELIEALQATGNYLEALRRSPNPDGKGLRDGELVEHALSQWMRAQHAVRELNGLLNGHSRTDR